MSSWDVITNHMIERRENSEMGMTDGIRMGQDGRYVYEPSQPPPPPIETEAPAAPEENTVMDAIGEGISDVLKGVGSGVVTGLSKAGQEIGDTFTGGFYSSTVMPWLRENVPGLSSANEALAEATQPEGTTQEVSAMIAEPLSQIVAPGALVTRGLQAAGIGSRLLREFLGYGTAEVAAVAPKDQTLLEMGIELIDESSEVRAMLDASLGAQEDENAFMERLKNAPRRFFEGGPLGLVAERAIEGIGMVYRAIKNSPKYQESVQRLNEGKSPMPVGMSIEDVSPEDAGRLTDSPISQDKTDFSLVRFQAPKGASPRVKNLAERLTDAPEAANKFRELARAGEDIGREWYNTDELAQRFVDVLGEDEGIPAFKEYIMLVGATSTGSKVQPNIRNASFYYQIGTEELMAIADDLLSGDFVPPRGSGYGHKMQKNQAGNVGKIVTGQWGPDADPRLNPKPRGFAQSLLGSNRNIAADKHFMRLMGMMSDDPAFLHNSAEISKTLIDELRSQFGKSIDKFITTRMVNGKPAYNFNAKAAVLGSKKQKNRPGKRPIKGLYEFIKDKSSVWDDMPNDNEYAFLEKFAGAMADEMGMTAPQFQASLWMGAAKETGVDPSSLDTFMNIFDRILRERAKERGLTEQQVFEQFVKRQAPLMVPLAATGALATGDEE